ERRIEGAFVIHARGLPPGIFERIHFAMQNDAAILHAPIVSSANDLPPMNEDRPNRDSSLSSALLGLFDRRLHEFIHEILLPLSIPYRCSAVPLTLILFSRRPILFRTCSL